MKAADHSVQEPLRNQPVEIEWVAGTIGKEREEAGLCAAVVFAKWMYGIESRQEMRRGRGEDLR
jgi:hypothetical protein